MTGMNLSGQQAWVCGASRGIGRAIAEILAQQGAALTLFARNLDALESLIQSLPQPELHRYALVDFSDTQALKAKTSELIAQHPAPAILIHNTGGPTPGPIHSAPIEQFEQALRPHLLAAQILAQAVLPAMRSAQYGRIITVLSTSVRQPIAGLGVSNTIRAAMASWAKTLASEVAADGITVNTILPGFTRTERLDEIIHNRAQRTGLSPEQIQAQMLAEVPAKRFAEAQEIAAAACFLASPLASYITGVSLPVDGGRIQAL